MCIFLSMIDSHRDLETMQLRGQFSYIYTVAMMPRPLQKQVDKGSYKNKFKGYSSKCVYL